MTTTTTKVQTRWMIRRDFASGLAKWVPGWGEGRILKHLRQRHTIGFVAETPAGEVVGFMLYSLRSRKQCDCKPQCGWVRLLAVGVKPSERRKGIGSQLVAKLVSKTHGTHRKTSLVATVAESNLPAQLLLRSAGLMCEGTIPERFGDQDGFRFVGREGRDF